VRRMIKVKVVHNKKYGVINVYIEGLEKVFEILKRHGFEQGDEENGVLTWFWYSEDVNIEKLIDELKRIGIIVEYVEEQ
jgi:hypothetical protein